MGLRKSACRRVSADGYFASEEVRAVLQAMV